MSALSLRLPHSLHERARTLARLEGISINHLISTLLAEKKSALPTEEYFRERGQRASRARFLAALAKVPDVDPEDHDKLRAATASKRRRATRGHSVAQKNNGRVFPSRRQVSRGSLQCLSCVAASGGSIKLEHLETIEPYVFHFTYVRKHFLMFSQLRKHEKSRSPLIDRAVSGGSAKQTSQRRQAHRVLFVSHASA